MKVQAGGGRNAANNTPAVVLAVENGHFELALRLISRGADPNDQRGGFSPLHVISWVRKPKSGDGIDGDPPPRGSASQQSSFCEADRFDGANPNLQLTNRRTPGKAELNMMEQHHSCWRAKLRFAIDETVDRIGSRSTACQCRRLRALFWLQQVLERWRLMRNRVPNLRSWQLWTIFCPGCRLAWGRCEWRIGHARRPYRAFPKVVSYLHEKGLRSETWNHKNKHGWSPFDIADGKRPGSVKPNPCGEEGPRGGSLGCFTYLPNWLVAVAENRRTIEADERFRRQQSSWLIQGQDRSRP